MPGCYSQAKKGLRQAVNKWIRARGYFDVVIDFDAALREPDQPSRMLSRYASHDHLHPNDAGCQAMADAVHGALLQ